MQGLVARMKEHRSVAGKCNILVELEDDAQDSNGIADNVNQTVQTSQSQPGLPDLLWKIKMQVLHITRQWQAQALARQPRLVVAN